jgi:hypothetical protein
MYFDGDVLCYLLIQVPVSQKKKVRCPTCNASRYKMNYENADDGSVDNRKKKGQNQKETTDEG